MRPIKFRAWAIKEKMLLQDIGILPLGNKLSWAGNPRKPNTPEPLINPKSTDFVIMQFTGLLDKNGKEIYEGDIVACDDGGEYFTYEGHPDYPEKYAIAWNDEFACFELKDKEDLEYSPFGVTTFEVIGNIYENKELLK